jgi:hypothetical protein
MKGIFLLFSVACFLGLASTRAYASSEFSVSVSFGPDAVEASLGTVPAAETTVGECTVEQVSFGMPYCLDSSSFAVEAAFEFGTDLIDIPEPCGGMAAGLVFILLCRKLTVNTPGKELENE